MAKGSVREKAGCSWLYGILLAIGLTCLLPPARALAFPPRAAFPGQAPDICCVAFSPDGRTLAAGDSDARVRVWDLFAPKKHK